MVQPHVSIAIQLAKPQLEIWKCALRPSNTYIMTEYNNAVITKILYLNFYLDRCVCLVLNLDHILDLFRQLQSLTTIFLTGILLDHHLTKSVHN